MYHKRRLSLQDHDMMFRRTGTLTDIKELDEQKPAEKASSEDSLRIQENAEGGNEIGSQSSAVHQAVLENNVELLKKLVEEGANMNELDSTGWPPLNTAIRDGKTDCAAYLLKQGAGEFYYRKQKQEYLQRLEKSKTKTRRMSHWR